MSDGVITISTRRGSHRRAFELMAEHVERIVATLEEDGLDRDLVVEWV
jgi:hypothetical protein